MSYFDNTNAKTAWARYHYTLNDFLGGTQSDTLVQPCAIAQTIEWDSSKPLFNLYLRNITARTKPSWGPLYRPSGTLVDREYNIFLLYALKSLNATFHPANEGKIEGLRKKLENLGKELTKVQNESDTAWNQYVSTANPQTRLNRPEWEAQYGWASRKGSLQIEIDNNTTTLFQELIVNGPKYTLIGEALANFSNQPAKVKLPNDPDAADPVFRDSWESYHPANIIGDLKAFLAGNNVQTFLLKDGLQFSSDFESRWALSGEIGWGWFSVEGGASGGTSETHYRDDTTQISVKFKNLAPFNVSLGESWYDGALINQFLVDVNNVEPGFWGANGGLNVIPLQAILGCGLEITVNTSKVAVDTFKQWQTERIGGGFRIGPFSFGASGSKTTSYAEATTSFTDTTITISDTSNRAYLVAMVSRQPYSSLSPGQRHITNGFGDLDAIVVNNYRSMQETRAKKAQLEFAKAVEAEIKTIGNPK
jgi:hypothetical protein